MSYFLLRYIDLCIHIHTYDSFTDLYLLQHSYKHPISRYMHTVIHYTPLHSTPIQLYALSYPLLLHYTIHYSTYTPCIAGRPSHLS